ncbi:interleukin-1 receptor-associated kinase 3 isoform X2 [Scophthalmus maximus]|uniref:interleukin-1 receptor-associated kinase 3 isoform X2 n=1 Tax=Scophthalmus maximus TaxID=52904 RepID=UPI001FA9142A|nr:interleukin-1 receptor-associated kinase 3 isoform X2 [Scophthalmus maximus]
MDPHAFLYDAPPDVLEGFYRIMDTGGDTLGWRGLAVRILPTYLEVRMLERLEAAGRSPTRELLWTWAQQNSRVRDLVKVLEDMGHHRALQLFQGLPQVRSSGEKQPHVITLRDVIRGTCSFHPERRIAEGHFSNVYRAQIGNATFAVKLFKQINSVSWKKLWDVFRKEMEIHHTYQHPNILDLLGCFSDKDHYCLVYPYLPNGSLFHRLHQQVQDGELPLSWEERLAIIKGMAKALHHLQTAQPCPVVCGNISSTNVLLDDALQPKLSDFGLARLRPHSATQYCTVTLDTSSHSNLGYLPEEYIRDGKLSASLDVYSFGMVIMETVTGRKVKEEAPQQMLLRDLLVTQVEESGGVDSCLRFLDRTAGQWPAAMAVSLLALALDCAAGRPRHRPSMENVLLALSQLLPPPRCPPADQPRSLDDGAPVNASQSPPSSVPAEQDEQRSLPGSAAPAGPCECSQSEVTYLSDTTGAHGEAEPDLYSSWPVECSCSAEAAGLACEDCRANMLTSDVTGSPQYSSMVENEAKSRLRNKLSLYDKGLIHTEELFSETGLQERVESLQLS